MSLPGAAVEGAVCAVADQDVVAVVAVDGPSVSRVTVTLAVSVRSQCRRRWRCR